VSQYQKNNSSTDINHHSSTTIHYYLPLSTAIHSILLVQFTCLTVFLHDLSQVLFGLPLGLASSTSNSMHIFAQSLSSFCNTCPHNCNLFCCSIEIMSFIPNLFLNSDFEDGLRHWFIKRSYGFAPHSGKAEEEKESF